ncbi:uncharacterized protein EMPS_00850 [Entomortierella parvispora]|uniref:SET domain-containing protein n=1 Tax=Entomortierella parvispora TaxID=205924 RepID=A0A9P3H1S4_9FUNG|nr:uncharacterized protein EMPS_00850 [Entomortierella parvispora]
MSAKLSSTVPSPSIANLANKVINRLANSNNINSALQSTGHLTATNDSNVEEEDDDDSVDNDEDDEDAGIIRCICNYIDDDGFTIQCERCLVWQHAVCVGIVQSNVPDKYLCELCSPRPVDRKRANEIQRRRNGTLDRKREKSPSRRKPSVGRPRKQFGSTGSTQTEPGVNSQTSSSSTPSTAVSSGNSQRHSSKDQASSSAGGGSSGYGARSNATGLNASTETAGRKGKSTNSSSALPNGTNNGSPQSSGKQRPSGNSRTVSATVEDEDLDMESDSQDDAMDAYQFEFSSVDTNIVTSKAVQDVFRQVIAHFRQVQSRKRSLSLTSGVKLQELVSSNISKTSDNTTPTTHKDISIANSALTIPSAIAPSIPETPDLLAMSNGQSTLATMDASNVVSMERESLARPLMKTTVKHILSSTKSHPSPAPQYGLFAESNIGAGRFMLEFKGEVSLKSTYKSDPINQYSILATPKPFVLFHPQLNLAVDARRSGNDARFVRRSCMPNTEVKSIVVPGVQDQTVHLGLFAKVPIGKGQEITLDWDWNRDHLALQSLRSLNEKSKDGTSRKSAKDIRKAKYLVASTLYAQTDCACAKAETCILHQMWKDGSSESISRESELSSKGHRPKKVSPESTRQRHRARQETSGLESQDGNRSTGQETSEDELSSVAETSPRKKHPKATVKLESSSKKARHDAHSQHRGNRWDDQDSDSNSDDVRRRKQSNPDSHVSPSRRSSTTGQEMSAREMKVALMQIKKMEDRDFGQAGPGRLGPSSLTADSAKSKNSGLSLEQQSRRAAIPTPRSRAKESTRKHSTADEGNISIGDSGIDSDSNNGTLHRETASLTKGGLKRPRVNLEKRLQNGSQSSATSDSDRYETANRLTQRRSSTSIGKKQPYAAASRGRRMAENASGSPGPKDHSLQRRADRHSGSSSLETSFVSIVGNTSDEEEERIQRSDRRHQRENNLPKEILPVPSLKPSVLPCKKLWKLIYMKQRAVAEEEAREKAEEMRRKAEEVFDLKMEEEAVDVTEYSPTPDDAVAPVPSEASGVKDGSIPLDLPTQAMAPSMVPKDILNLFHEDVKPEPSRETLRKNSTTNSQTIDGPSMQHDQKPKDTDTLLTAVKGNQLEDKDVNGSCPMVQPQIINLGPHQATQTAEETQAGQTEPSISVNLSELPPTLPPTRMPIAESQDVEMVDANTAVNESLTHNVEVAASKEDLSLTKPEVIAIPKVKLSLQEYQRQRQEASLRTAASSDTKPSDPVDNRSQERGNDKDVMSDATVGGLDVDPVVDVEMGEHSRSTSKSETAAAEAPSREEGYYFKVGSSLPTPLVGLSPGAHAARPVSNDYFPVQPFSPTSLSVGPTPFSNLNLISSPPHPQTALSRADDARSPARSPVSLKLSSSTSPKSPGVRAGPSPGPTSPGWRTPKAQRASSPLAPGNTSFIAGHRPSSEEARLTSPRFHGPPSERSDRSSVAPLSLPQRERQLPLTSSAPYDGSYYGTGDEPIPYKRHGPLASPGAPSISRDYYKDERSRHRSMNDEEWGYNNMDAGPYGGYRGSRGAPPPPPRDRDRDRDRERERDRDSERDWNRDRRDRYDRRGDYPNNGGSGAPFYGPHRVPIGQGNMLGGHGRRSSREEPYGSDMYREHVPQSSTSTAPPAGHHSSSHLGDESSSGSQHVIRRP